MSCWVFFQAALLSQTTISRESATGERVLVAHLNSLELRATSLCRWPTDGAMMGTGVKPQEAAWSDGW